MTNLMKEERLKKNITKKELAAKYIPSVLLALKMAKVLGKEDV
jgi:DNA-binding XRE family transcriptional regulator